MGMYDNIDEYQVKCFDIPLYHKDDHFTDINFSNSGLYFSGGQLRYFSKGSIVPYKTLWYNYTPNFAIYNYDFMFEEESFIIIKKGKVSKIIRNIDKVDIKDFKNINYVINYFGSFLRVNKPEDLKSLKKDMLTYRELYDSITKENKEYFSKSLHYHHISIGVKKSEENISIEEAKKLSKEYLEKAEKARKEEENKINDIKEVYLTPWFEEESESDMKFYTFGALISCYKFCKDRIGSGSSNKDNNRYEDDYNYLVIEIKEFLKEDNFIENFFSFQNLDESEEIKIKEYIEEIKQMRYIEKEE